MLQEINTGREAAIPCYSVLALASPQAARLHRGKEMTFVWILIDLATHDAHNSILTLMIA